MMNSYSLKNKIIINLIISVIISIYGCKKEIIYKGNKDLIGKWKGYAIEIKPNNKNDLINFDVENYGYARLELNKDSAFTFMLEIMKDVVVDKEIFGNQYGKKVIQAGYKKYKRGFYLADSNKIVFYDYNKITNKNYKYYFRENILYTIFSDKKIIYGI